VYARKSSQLTARGFVSRLAVVLLLAGNPIAAHATDNAVVDGMLRLMENFGFIDHDNLPLGVPYLPSASAVSPLGWSGLPGSATPMMPGSGQFPGTAPLGAMGFPGSPGLGQPGGGWPGAPWANAPPGANQFVPQGYGWPGTAAAPVAGLLDGIWELNRGGIVVIRADAARLYVSRDRFQDYLIRYDDSHFWWRPRDGSQFERYRYRMEEGRMVLADREGNLLLLRRRR
jgi:hypothetical protein